MKYIFLYAIIFFFSLNLIISQENLTLEDAIQLGIKNNFSVNLQRLNVKKSENSMAIAKAGFLPSLDLNVNKNNSNNNVNQEFVDGRRIERSGATSNSLDASLKTQWTIFDGFEMFIDYDLLKLSDDIEKLKLKREIENLIQEIITRYSELIIFKDAINLSSDNLQVSRERYRIISDKKDVGKSSAMDLINAEVDMNRDITDSIEVYNNFIKSKTNFNQVLGRDIKLEFNPVDSLFLMNENFDLSKLMLQIENNTDLKLAELGIEVSKKDIEKLKSNYYPKISLFGGYSYSSLESQAGFLKSNTTNGFNYGVTFSMNIFEGFRNNTLIENNQVNLEMSKLSKQELVSFLEKEINNTLISINKSKEVLNFNIKNYELALKNLSIAQEKLLSGAITQIEFREAQLKAIQSYNLILSEKLNQKTNETYLMKIIGQIVK